MMLNSATAEFSAVLGRGLGIANPPPEIVFATLADFDLGRHQEFSGKKLEYFDQASNRRYTPFVIETLQSELMVPSQTWNPTSFLTMALPPQQMGEIETSAPQLTVAIGGAMASF